MKTTLAVIAVALLTLCSGLVRAAPGALDPSFSGNGKFEWYPGIPNAYVYAVAVDLNGRILIGGKLNSDFAIIRVKVDGEIDSTSPGFGNGGVVLTDFSGSTDSVHAIAVQQNDGKIVAAGYAYQAGNADFAIVKQTDGCEKHARYHFWRRRQDDRGLRRSQRQGTGYPHSAGVGGWEDPDLRMGE